MSPGVWFANYREVAGSNPAVSSIFSFLFGFSNLWIILFVVGVDKKRIEEEFRGIK